jgi:hypothetical protein
MVTDGFGNLGELAAAVAAHAPTGFVDLYLERRVEVQYNLANRLATSREHLLREGAAVRRGTSLASADGIDRAVLARLLEVGAGTLPTITQPHFPHPPTVDDVLERLPSNVVGLRWRWSRAAVVRTDGARVIRRPELAEITLDDGHRILVAWPPVSVAATAAPGPGLAQAHPGRVAALFRPAAAAVLIHELFGHPLEADLFRRGGSPWAGRIGERLLDIPIDLVDDPTHPGLPGGFSVDDEGTPAAPRKLLTAGVLTGILADREGAAALGVPAGNARRAHVHASPRARSSNLVASAPGALGEPPMADAAIEIVSLASGTVEPASGIALFEVRLAFALRRGTRWKALAPFTLVAQLAEIRRGVRAAALPLEPSAEPGWCGKDGEVVPTGGVAPCLLVADLEIR